MTYADPTVDPADRADALVDAVRGRKDLKRLGKWLEDQGDDALKAALIARAAKHGVELPDEAIAWPGKRLLRRALAREPEARERTTPIARDEDFTCRHCGKPVPRHGRTARDHCPWCLRSSHVDDVPGDRASDCGGRMDPYEVELNTDGVRIHYRCTRCGVEKRVRAVTDGEVPDSWDALVKLSSGTLG